MVTKDMLAQMRSGRIKNNARLDYTIGGTIQTHVISTLEIEREKQIKQGERALQDALRDMQREQALSSHDGLAKAHFNHPKQEI